MGCVECYKLLVYKIRNQHLSSNKFYNYIRLIIPLPIIFMITKVEGNHADKFIGNQCNSGKEIWTRIKYIFIIKFYYDSPNIFLSIIT